MLVEGAGLLLSYAETSTRVIRDILPKLRRATVNEKYIVRGAKRISRIRKQTKNARAHYMDLFNGVRYLIKCTQLSLDRLELQELSSSTSLGHWSAYGLRRVLRYLAHAETVSTEDLIPLLAMYAVETKLAQMEATAQHLRQALFSPVRKVAESSWGCANFRKDLGKFCQTFYHVPQKTYSVDKTCPLYIALTNQTCRTLAETAG